MPQVVISIGGIEQVDHQGRSHIEKFRIRVPAVSQRLRQGVRRDSWHH